MVKQIIKVSITLILALFVTLGFASAASAVVVPLSDNVEALSVSNTGTRSDVFSTNVKNGTLRISGDVKKQTRGVKKIIARVGETTPFFTQTITKNGEFNFENSIPQNGLVTITLESEGDGTITIDTASTTIDGDKSSNGSFLYYFLPIMIVGIMLIFVAIIVG